jgi:lysophospholipase L1-like esterase
MSAMLAAIVFAASWIGTWATAPSGADKAITFTDVTLREIVHVSAGGEQVRVRFTNRFGEAPLSIDAASIAISKGGGPSAVAGTMRRLSFFGKPSVTVPAGTDVVSDGVDLPVAPQSDLIVSLHVPGPTGAPTYHHLAYEHTYSAPNDEVDDESDAPFAQEATNWYFLASIDVAGSASHGAVVALGDSITNGQGSTVDGHNRWTDDLAQRLQLGVLNEAIDGNRILVSSPRFGPSALARFDDDVLSQTGVSDLIVLLGINDIQQSPHDYDAAAIEFGLQQLAQRAHAHGIRVVACTITPYEGWLTYEPRGDRTREAVNTFIRTSKIFDGVADFDAVVRDPSRPSRMLPSYDSGDHLHPNAAAYKAMAAAVSAAALFPQGSTSGSGTPVHSAIAGSVLGCGAANETL